MVWFSGPPSVITRIWSKARNESRVATTRANAVVGRNAGHVTCQNLLQACAPSTRAASATPRGTAVRPARNNTTIVPSSCQSPISAIAGSASVVEVNQSCTPRTRPTVESISPAFG